MTAEPIVSSPTERAGAAPTPGAAPAIGRRRRRRSNSWSAWLFLLPALAFFTVFKFWPTIKGVQQSLQEVRPYLGNRFVGLANYRMMVQDKGLRSAFVHTVIDTAGVMVASLVAGLALALLLEGPARSLRIMRTAVFLPAVTSIVVAAQLWNVLLYPTSDGFVNRLLSFVGIGPQQFLSDPHQSLASVMLIQVWQAAPYNMVLYVAGLSTINSDLYEAASIDGANWWQKLRSVTWPGLRPITTIVVTLGIIRGLRVFTEIYVLTGGGPASSSETVITYSYKQGIVTNNLGYSSAISTALLVLTVVLTVGQLWWTRRREA